ncbi:MAG: tetratricopeptide repeat protein [Stellaceae bacterium]
MRRRQANRAALLLVLPLLVGAAPSPTPVIPIGPPSQQYDACLAQAKRDPQAALKAAEFWREAGGGFPAEHCAAIALIELKRYPEAAQRLEALAGAMMTEPAALRGDALDQAGQAWLLANQPDRAKAAFDAALGFAPRNPDFMIDHAEALADGGQYWEAIDDLNRALEIDPDSVDALVFRASAYRHVGGADALDLAQADADRALKLAPNSVPGLLERGNIRRLRGDAAGAKTDWQRVIALAPQSQAAHYARDNLAHIDDNPLLIGNPQAPAR